MERDIVCDVFCELVSCLKKHGHVGMRMRAAIDGFNCEIRVNEARILGTGRDLDIIRVSEGEALYSRHRISFEMFQHLVRGLKEEKHLGLRTLKSVDGFECAFIINKQGLFGSNVDSGPVSVSNGQLLHFAYVSPSAV